MTSDADLLDELLALAAAGCGDVDVAPDATAARQHWRTATLVVIGADAVTGCVRAGLPRRRGLVLVARLPDLPDGTRDPAAEDAASWRAASQLDADHVVVLPAAAAWLTERFGSAGARHRDAAPIVAVIGGRGGAGASVLAAGLALTAARNGLRTMLVDADPLGGGVDLLLGAESAAGLRWPDLSAARGRVDVAALRAGLPRQGELAMVSWDRGDAVEVPVEAMEATLDAGRRGGDLVVIDLPRTLGPAAMCGVRAAGEVLMPVTADIRACAAAVRVAAQVGPHCQALRLVVRGPAPGGLSAHDVGVALGLPVAGSLRPEPDLAAALERGDPPTGSGRGPLAELCARLLAELTADAGREVA
ncbi:septum site-determining protein Ssd [Actinocatenispora thailandica]|uniref:septum site-determining protein Ssd n=1 Tax=Actinocatenispora thailandica TaxID=227318 RepID=UPI0019525E12|nr:septum site-determining protein Ssd [Actinocatenispora thailandica]